MKPKTTTAFDKLHHHHLMFAMSSQTVLNHIRAENAYCAAQTDHLEKLQKELYDEMLSHLKETDDEVLHLLPCVSFFALYIRSWQAFFRSMTERLIDFPLDAAHRDLSLCFVLMGRPIS